jgi:hypothetical protein
MPASAAEAAIKGAKSASVETAVAKSTAVAAEGRSRAADDQRTT